MNFLAPLFLAGAAAVVLPVVFHLIRRKTREQVPFSSLMFLRVSPPRLTKRSRLEDLLLLLLRCLVLGLLAAAFARPFFRRPLVLPELQGTIRREIVLLDASASMRRGGLWDAARSKALTSVDAAAPGDAVAVYRFDRQLRPVVTFAEWSSRPSAERKAMVRARLGALTPGWGDCRPRTRPDARGRGIIGCLHRQTRRDASGPFDFRSCRREPGAGSGFV